MIHDIVMGDVSVPAEANNNTSAEVLQHDHSQQMNIDCDHDIEDDHGNFAMI